VLDIPTLIHITAMGILTRTTAITDRPFTSVRHFIGITATAFIIQDTIGIIGTGGKRDVSDFRSRRAKNPAGLFFRRR
jgi:hypothetical protein